MADIALKRIQEWVSLAGELALARFRHVRPSLKAGDEIVTDADREIEAFLVQRLQEACPGDQILGEEMGGCGTARDRLWLIDPIDGTRAFASGLPIWGISVGLVELCPQTRRYRPTRGVFYLPVLREWYIVDSIGGARWNQEELSPLHLDRWDHHSFICVPSDAHRRYDIRFSGIARSLGSTAAHMLYVARGAAVGALLGQPRLWDVAAAWAILGRVGGEMRYLSGAPVEIEPLLGGRKALEPIVCASAALIEPLRRCITLRKEHDQPCLPGECPAPG